MIAVPAGGVPGPAQAKLHSTMPRTQHNQEKTGKTGYGRALLGWNMLDLNFTTGALLGYSSEKSMVSLKVPAHACKLSACLQVFPCTNTAARDHRAGAYRRPRACPLGQI